MLLLSVGTTVPSAITGHGRPLGELLPELHDMFAEAEFAPVVTRAAGGGVLLAPPPTLASALGQRELQFMRDLQGVRTPEGIARATWLGDNGARKGAENIWFGYAREVAASGRPGTANAEALVRDAMAAADADSHVWKDLYDRPRPVEVAPDLLPVVFFKGSSYPSTHAAMSFAAANALASLDPSRGAEFLQMAHEVAFSRVYGAAHSPIDVRAGQVVGEAAWNRIRPAVAP